MRLAQMKESKDRKMIKNLTITIAYHLPNKNFGHNYQKKLAAHTILYFCKIWSKVLVGGRVAQGLFYVLCNIVNK